MQDSPIAAAADLTLASALRKKLQARYQTSVGLGSLDLLAVRMALIQGTLAPRLIDPQMLVFAGDHGLVVDRILPPSRSTALQVQDLLAARLPLVTFCLQQGVQVKVVDAGVAEVLPAHPALIARKIGHGSRNSRLSAAMSAAQAHAAIRAGMEIADTLPGNALAIAGMGEGSFESAALVMARLAEGLALRQILATPTVSAPQDQARQLMVLQSALGRHGSVTDPVEVLAALGGYEVAMMVGAILVSAGKRKLVIVDGLPACAAALVASRIARAALDYCVFCRSHKHPGLDAAFGVFSSPALMDLGLDSVDGTGAALCWPLLRAAEAMLSDAGEIGSGEAPTTLGLGMSR